MPQGRGSAEGSDWGSDELTGDRGLRTDGELTEVSFWSGRSMVAAGGSGAGGEVGGGGGVLADEHRN